MGYITNANNSIIYLNFSDIKLGLGDLIFQKGHKYVFIGRFHHDPSVDPAVESLIKNSVRIYLVLENYKYPHFGCW